MGLHGLYNDSFLLSYMNSHCNQVIKFAYFMLSNSSLWSVALYFTHTIWIMQLNLCAPNSYDRSAYIDSVGLLVIYSFVKISNFLSLWHRHVLLNGLNKKVGGGGWTFSPPALIIISLRNMDLWDVRPYNSQKKMTFRVNIPSPSFIKIATCFLWFLAWLNVQLWRYRRHFPRNMGIYTALQLRWCNYS
jgi:hypothetical protein